MSSPRHTPWYWLWLAADSSSIGMLLGYHILWSQIADVVGTDAQADALHEAYVTNNYYIGGAVNPRDNDLKIADDGHEIAFTGFKHFTTGAAVSDLLVLEGALDGEHIFAVVPTKQAGISFAYNWNNVGLRLTESGSVTITDVRAPWGDALGWDAASKKRDPAVLGVPFATILLPLIQLIFSNFYIGIALGALATAKGYTTTTTRPWPFGGDVGSTLSSEKLTLEQGQGDGRILHPPDVRQLLRPPLRGRGAHRQGRRRRLRPPGQIRGQPCRPDHARARRVRRARRQRQGREHGRGAPRHRRPVRGHWRARDGVQGRL